MVTAQVNMKKYLVSNEDFLILCRVSFLLKDNKFIIILLLLLLLSEHLYSALSLKISNALMRCVSM